MDIKTKAELMLMNHKCKIFARVFELSVRDGLDSYDFAKIVMTNKAIDWLYKTDDCQEWADGEFLYSVLRYRLKFKTGKVLDNYLMEFAGYLYKYWMINKGMDRKEIYKILPLKRLEATFGFYHTQGWEYIIADATRVYNEKSFIV